MYQDRLPFYRTLEEQRNSALLVYVTGDRRGLESQIHQEVIDLIVEHLDLIGPVPQISLYLYTRGGHTLAAWSIANLLIQFADEFEVIIPSKAHSAGTLIALGAKTLVMTKQATLGPIDPSVNTPLNPAVPGAPPNARVPVSVEAINGFFELAKTTGVSDGSDIAAILTGLTSHVHPLVLGEVFRTRGQIRMLGSRLLAKHIGDQAKIERILQFLCSESGSHDYSIYRREARNDLGLNVEIPSEALYSTIKSIYDDIAAELQLGSPLIPAVLVGDQDQVAYQHRRAIIESVRAGSHVFISEGTLVKRPVLNPQTGLPEDLIDDNRVFEGWRHERA